MTKKEDSPEPTPQVATPEPVVAQPAPVAPPAYVPQQQASATPASNETTLAITSLILGIVSVVALGLFTGIPAIITGSIALKKKQGGRGMSIAGIITGAVGTVFSLLVIAFFIFVFALSAHSYNSGNPYEYMTPRDSYEMRSFNSDRT